MSCFNSEIIFSDYSVPTENRIKLSVISADSHKCLAILLLILCLNFMRVLSIESRLSLFCFL